MAAASRKFQYKVPNYLFNGYSIATNGPTAGAFRGYGNAQLTFGRELMMSRIARKLLTPWNSVCAIMYRQGKVPCRHSSGYSCGGEKCARRCQRSGGDRREGLADNEEIRQAWGVSFACHGSALPPKKE
ncbi:MAG: molybdopterin cofactor-binding domain-containing protein [Blautia marasmi]